MDPSGVDISLMPSDRRALTMIISSDPIRPDFRRLYWLVRTVLWVVLVLLSLAHPVVWGAVIMEAGLVLIETRGRRQLLRHGAYDVLNGRYEVSPRGLLRTSEVGETLIAWGAIEHLGQSGEHLFVRFSSTGWVLPFRCFASENHRRDFVSALERYVGGATTVVTQ